MPALVGRWLVRWCMHLAVRVEIADMTALGPDPRIDRAIDQRRPARSQARRNLNTPVKLSFQISRPLFIQLIENW
jgi:hypothetical protein